MTELVTNISDESFDTEVLKCSVPVIVDFWAEGVDRANLFANY